MCSFFPLYRHPGQKKSCLVQVRHWRETRPARRCLFFFFSIPFIIFALSFSLSLLVVTQIRGHIRAGSSPPLPSPVRFVPCILSREGFSSFFPRRLASNCLTTKNHFCSSAQSKIGYTAIARKSSGWILIAVELCQRLGFALPFHSSVLLNYRMEALLRAHVHTWCWELLLCWII